MEENNISFKATLNGLVLIMPAEGDFDTVIAGIEKKLESSGRFFKGASLAVKYRGRKLTSEQESIIVKLLSERTDAEIKSFDEDLTQPEKEQDDSSERAFDRPKMRMIYFKGLDEGMTRFYKGTVRSGQLVSYEGNIVIIGDVNPGGEVIAAGNVVVMGALRGMVHAGADGNKEAVVAALSLQPTQLRIADVITRPPDAEGEREIKNQYIPEMAFVKDNLVYIERFLPQYK